MPAENVLLTQKHILVYLDDDKTPLVNELTSQFCGVVVTQWNPDTNPTFSDRDRTIYVGGNIAQTLALLPRRRGIRVIAEVSHNYQINSTDYQVVALGQVPFNIHGMGVLFKELFSGKDYFKLLHQEHEFQTLTESNKPDKALRKGIYLSQVGRVQDLRSGSPLSGESRRFHLLRCSSNLDGPTDNFRNTDSEIVTRVNAVSEQFFHEQVDLNHVLAQVYYNNGNHKAKIKAHADKTKDMPAKGLIAFCTFYQCDEEKRLRPSAHDPFDLCYNKTSALTSLHFRLKKTVVDESLVKEFSVTLYPNSVFIIPLSTNRWYTHEIKPSLLPSDKILTRLGYVLRCSKQLAVFLHDRTYIEGENGDLTKLEPISLENHQLLKDLYAEENTTDHRIVYPTIFASMNLGDYQQPRL